MRILLLGATGQVGWELQRCLMPLGRVRALGRAAADLAEPESLRAVIRGYQPEVIVNAAAYTAVDRAASSASCSMLTPPPFWPKRRGAAARCYCITPLIMFSTVRKLNPMLSAMALRRSTFMVRPSVLAKKGSRQRVLIT